MSGGTGIQMLETSGLCSLPALRYGLSEGSQDGLAGEDPQNTFPGEHTEGEATR